MAPQRQSRRNPQNLPPRVVKGTVQMYEVKGSEPGRLSRVVQVGPVGARSPDTGGQGSPGRGEVEGWKRKGAR